MTYTFVKNYTSRKLRCQGQFWDQIGRFGVLIFDALKKIALSMHLEYSFMKIRLGEGYGKSANKRDR